MGIALVTLGVLFGVGAFFGFNSSHTVFGQIISGIFGLAGAVMFTGSFICFELQRIHTTVAEAAAFINRTRSS